MFRSFRIDLLFSTKIDRGLGVPYGGIAYISPRAHRSFSAQKFCTGIFNKALLMRSRLFKSATLFVQRDSSLRFVWLFQIESLGELLR